jgi:hypothetical protein
VVAVWYAGNNLWLVLLAAAVVINIALSAANPRWRWWLHPRLRGWYRLADTWGDVKNFSWGLDVKSFGLNDNKNVLTMSERRLAVDVQNNVAVTTRERSLTLDKVSKLEYPQLGSLIESLSPSMASQELQELSSIMEPLPATQWRPDELTLEQTDRLASLVGEIPEGSRPSQQQKAMIGEFLQQLPRETNDHA